MGRKGYEFQREVAAIYRTLGAKVSHDMSLAGNQIDVLVTEGTPSGLETRVAVECKAYSRPVGIDVVNSFNSVTHLLKGRQLVERAVLVSSNGFTHKARSAAAEYGLELLELADLQQRVAGREEAVRRAEHEVDAEEHALSLEPDRPRRVFVIMPFSREFDDVYILGIRAVAEELGLVVERADSIEHN